MIILDIFLNILYYVLHIYAICFVIAGILSFVNASPYNPIVTFFRVVTAPPCRFLVKRYPKLMVRTDSGYMDLSPIVFLLIIGCVLIVIQKIAFYLGIYI
jgi:YggT family protein